MDVKLKFGIAVLAGVAAGLLAGRTLYAQSTPHAYLIVDVGQVPNAEKMKAAAKKAGPIFEKTGSKYLVRTNKVLPLHGTPPARFVIVEFANIDAAKAWANRPKTKAITAELDKYSTQRRFLVEGME